MNRAIAIAERDGPEVGLAALEALDGPALAGYQPFHAARADLLGRTGAAAEARIAYGRALELTTNEPERAFLESQRAALAEDR